MIVLGAVPLRCSRAWRAGIAAAALLVAAKFYLLRIFGGPNGFAPDLPRWIVLGSAWLYAMEFFWLLGAFPVAVLHLVLRGILFAAGHPLRPGWRELHNRISLVLLVVSFAVTTIGCIGGTAAPEIRRVDLAVRGGEGSGAKRFTVLVITDLHVDPSTPPEEIRRLVERCNELDADLVTILGDNVDGTVERCGKLLEPLAELRARCGVLAVTGNHEYYSGFKPWRDFLSVRGLRFLINEVVILPNGVAVAGIPDPQGIRFGVTRPDLAAAAAKLPRNRRAAILLSHRPGFARQAAGAGFDLQLSGHTHGGMVIGFDRLIALFNGGFVSGLYRVGAMTLYVSNGTGIWSGFPVRIGRPAEITLVTLSLPPDR